jgi:hypothetical protein
MYIHIESAYEKGMLDALSGADYNNPFTSPSDSDERFDRKPDHEESYFAGYDAHWEDFARLKPDYHAIVDDIGRD